MENAANARSIQAEERIDVRTSRHLGTWLKSRNVTVVVSSYQSGLILLVGANDKGHVVVKHHKFDRAMGLACDRGGLLSSGYRHASFATVVV